MHVWNSSFQNVTSLFKIRLNETVMNNAWAMRFYKTKCTEKQEVNSALPYESCLWDNTLLLIPHVFSQREKSLLLMCGFQKDCLRSRWNTNSKTVIQSVRSVEGKKRQERISPSGTESELLVNDDYRSSTLECNQTKPPALCIIYDAKCACCAAGTIAVMFAHRWKAQRKPWRRDAPVWTLRSTPSPVSWQT